MTSKYDLLITIDRQGGLVPGQDDRNYAPGQIISGFFDLTVYQQLQFSQIRIALLGFSETTFLENQRTWKEKHIFLKEVHDGLPGMQLNAGDKRHCNWSFRIPDFSHCETCNRSEHLPPQMDYTSDNSRQSNMSASITYQVEVLVETVGVGDIFFHEKFKVQPIDTGGASDVLGDKKKGFPYVDVIYKAKSPLLMDDPETKLFPVPLTKKKSSLFRSMFKSMSLDDGYNVPLRLEVRLSETSASLLSAGGPILPPIDLVFSIPEQAADKFPFVLECGTLSKLGEFYIKSVLIRAVFGQIQLSCAGRQGVIPDKRIVLFENQSMNEVFDLGLDQNTLRNGKNLDLVRDLTGTDLEIPLDKYGAQFNKHCNQIGRKGGYLVVSVGVASTQDAKKQYLEVTVPFAFKGLPMGLLSQSQPGGSNQLPDFLVPGLQDFKVPPGPTPTHYEAPSGAPPADFSAPSGPPPGHFEAPSGPPPGHFDAPPGPPPGHLESLSTAPTTSNDASSTLPPPGPPPGTSGTTTIAEDDAPPPAYTPVA